MHIAAVSLSSNAFGCSLSLVLQRSSSLVGIDDDARRQSFRAIERKCAWRSSLRKKAFPFAQQDRIDQQKHLIHKPMLEQRRSQRRAAPGNQVRAVLRLDAANAIHDVRSNALERAPFQALRPWVATYFVAA